MIRTLFRLVIRKMRGHLPQLIGMGLLVLVGVAFFVTLYTICLSYEQKAVQFFKAQNYADVTFYGSFEKSDVETVLAQQGFDHAQGRYVQDYENAGVTLRVISYTGTINAPYLYEGRLPNADDECLLLKKHAQARNIRLGDTLKAGGKTLRVTGICASPEYIYLVQNERALMAQSDRFGVVFVLADFYKDMPFNEIVAVGSAGAGSAEAAGRLIGAQRTVLKADQLNYTLYREDLNQIRTFAYIFPLIFALLIVMIIYVMLKRTITRERRQIGVYKALGTDGGKIIFIYVAQAGLTALISAVLGCIAAMLLCDTIIGFFSVMFEVPGLAFTFYPALWAGVILAGAALCVASSLLSVQSVIRPLPADLLRSRLPSGGKRLLLERIDCLWKRLSFNTRYALKSTLRNKGRFFAVLLGMCGSCALLTFALGFFNSAEYTQTAYFEQFARYDALLEFTPLPLTTEHPVSQHLGKINKALVTPVKIDGKEHRLTVVENGFDMLNIDSKSLKDGVIIPDYYAKKWRVQAGDTIRLGDTDTKVAGISAQAFGLSLYTSYDYAIRVFPDFPKAYNVIFAVDDHPGELADLSEKYRFEYSTLADDKTSFASVMKSLNTLIWFMLACAVILGLTVLYSVGLMNLSAREYEYMFMGVMGYPLKGIMLSHIKETFLQLILALPLGFITGYGILNVVKSEFSSDSFVLFAAIYPRSYLCAGIMVVTMTAFVALISARHINGLDIVEGLKAREE